MDRVSTHPRRYRIVSEDGGHFDVIEPSPAVLSLCPPGCVVPDRDALERLRDLVATGYVYDRRLAAFVKWPPAPRSR